MRDTGKYPVTFEEKLRALDKAIEHERSKQLFGGTTLLGLNSIRKDLLASRTEVVSNPLGNATESGTPMKANLEQSESQGR